MSAKFVSIALFLTLAGGAIAATPPKLTNVREFDLPVTAEWSQDIRWASGSRFFVAAGRIGVFAFDVPVDSELGKPEPVVPGERREGGFFFSARLAASDRYIVTASPFAAFGWKRASGDASLEQIRSFALSVDVDTHGDQLLVLGANRDEKGQWAPEGGIAWLGTLSKSLSDLRPVLYSELEPNALTLAKCDTLELGAVRFRSDGSFFIAPGVEPGVFWFDRTGKLLHAWDTSRLGFVDRCAIEDTWELLARNSPARNQWLSRHVVIDDMVVWDGLPALILRKVEGDLARWEMVILNKSGAPTRVPLPVRARSKVSRLRADLRGRDVIFVMSERQEHAREKGRPIAPSKVIIGRFSK